MNFQERFPSDDDIWSYSNPTVAQQNAFKNTERQLYYIEVKQKIKNTLYYIQMVRLLILEILDTLILLNIRTQLKE